MFTEIQRRLGATFLVSDEIPFRRGSGFRFGDEELTANQPLPLGSFPHMPTQSKNVQGAGTTERQEDWTIQSLTREFASSFELSRRKTAWLIQAVDRIIETCWADEEVELKVGEIEWAPQDLVEDLLMPRLFFPDQLSKIAFWFECAAYITDELAPRTNESEFGYVNRRQEMFDACDEAALL